MHYLLIKLKSLSMALLYEMKVYEYNSFVLMKLIESTFWKIIFIIWDYMVMKLSFIFNIKVSMSHSFRKIWKQMSGKKWLCIKFLETKQQHIRLSISASFHLSLDSTKFNHYPCSLYKKFVSIFCCEDAIIFTTPHRADMKTWHILSQIHNQPKRLLL